MPKRKGTMVLSMVSVTMSPRILRIFCTSICNPI